MKATHPDFQLNVDFEYDENFHPMFNMSNMARNSTAALIQQVRENMASVGRVRGLGRGALFCCPVSGQSFGKAWRRPLLNGASYLFHFDGQCSA